jgi:hypothetical protein
MQNFSFTVGGFLPQGLLVVLNMDKPQGGLENYRKGKFSQGNLKTHHNNFSLLF